MMTSEAADRSANLRGRFASLVGAVDSALLARAGVWLASFTLVLYLAFNNGGFGVAERSEVGIVAWWIVLVGTLVGALPPGGTSWAGRATLVLLAAFAAWTALALGWTESAERTWVELGKIVAYLGILAMALAIQGQGRWRAMLAGATAATGVVVVCAALYRLEPGLFAEQAASSLVPPGLELERRLSFPLNYSTGLATFVAMAVPLFLNAASAGGSLPGRLLPVAALPISGLVLWLTASSLALPLLAVGVLAYLLLANDRLARLATLLVAGIGAAVLIGAATQLEALDRGLRTPAAEQEGEKLLALCILVCGGVALAQVALVRAQRSNRRPSWLRFGRRATVAGSLVAVLAVLALSLATGLPSHAGGAWERFSSGQGSERASDGVGRPARGVELLDLSSAGRVNFWRSARDAFESEPLHGIGPGTFEFWWSRNGSSPAFVRDAHSVALETLAELGIVGFLLLVGFSVAAVAIGASRVIRGPTEIRPAIAAATAACLVFIAAAAVDWTMELGAIVALFMVFAAVAVGGGAEAPGGERRSPAWLRRSPPWVGRASVVLLSIAALAAISLPYSATTLVEESRSAATEGDLDRAVAKAQDAAAVAPDFATPLVQLALLRERQGRLDQAVGAARLATAREPTNWQTWRVLARELRRFGERDAARRAAARSRELNISAPTPEGRGRQ